MIELVKLTVCFFPLYAIFRSFQKFQPSEKIAFETMLTQLTVDTVIQTIQHYLHLLNTQLLLQPHQFGIQLVITVTAVSASLFWALLVIGYVFARLFNIAHDKLENKKKWEIAWNLAHIPFHSTMLILSNTWFFLQYKNGYVL